MDKLNCIFCATPEISVDTLEALEKNPSINISLVVSMPDRPAGRGKKIKSPPIIEAAKRLNLKTLQTENLNKCDEFFSSNEATQVDLIIVFAFAQFLNEKILHLPKLGCFNIHTSLLPKYRGAAPMQYALFNGDNLTGITIQKMVKKMDAGNIVYSEKINIDPSDNLGSLHDKMKQLAPSITGKFVEALVNNNLTEVEQDETKATFSPSIPKNETLLNFEKHSAENLRNRIRGLSPIPGAYCFIGSKRLKIFDSEISKTPLKPGEFTNKFNTLLIGTLEGSLHLRSVQLEGKSRCTDFQLINGFKSNNKQFTITSERITE